MKYILKSLPIFFLFGFVFAQNNALDPEAEALLKSVSAKYQSYASSKIDLQLEIDLPEVKEKQVIDVQAWIKGDKFKVDMKDQMFVSDNIVIWNYLKKHNEVQINDYEASDAMFSPSILFKLYTKDYVYRLKEEYKSSTGRLIKVIELSPIDKNQEFFKIDLKIDVANVAIVEAKIYEKSGMKYNYIIKAITPNVPLATDFFVFKTADYKNITITDMRF